MMCSDDEDHSSSSETEGLGPRLSELAQSALAATATAGLAPTGGPTAAAAAAPPPQKATQSSTAKLHVPHNPYPTQESVVKYDQIYIMPPKKGVYMPVYQLPLPDEPHGTVPPRTIRYRFEGPFKDRDRPAAIASIREQFKTMSVQQPAITFPEQHGAVKLVEVTFTTKAQFVRVRDARPHLQLRFNGHRMSRWLVGAALEPFEVAIEVEGPREPTITPAWHDALSPNGHIIEAWAEYTHKQDEPREFTGRIVCLLHCNVGKVQDLTSWLSSLSSALQLGHEKWRISYKH